MWDLPGPGLKPVSPALAGVFLTTAPPGKSPVAFLRLCPPSLEAVVFIHAELLWLLPLEASWGCISPTAPGSSRPPLGIPEAARTSRGRGHGDRSPRQAGTPDCVPPPEERPLTFRRRTASDPCLVTAPRSRAPVASVQLAAVSLVWLRRGARCLRLPRARSQEP